MSSGSAGAALPHNALGQSQQPQATAQDADASAQMAMSSHTTPSSTGSNLTFHPLLQCWVQSLQSHQVLLPQAAPAAASAMDGVTVNSDADASYPPSASPPATPLLLAMTPGLPPAHLLPPQTGPPRHTLVLDLDRTLIDCIMLQEPSCEPDFLYTDELGVQAKVWSRPFLRQFLMSVSKDFEVVLFTAAGPRHADSVLRVIDPHRTLFAHRLYGHHTTEHPLWGWVKDLSRLGRDLSRTLIVDDSVLAALLQPCSLVPIRPFDHADPRKDRDTALTELLRFLQDKVLPAKDVREAIALWWNKARRRPRHYRLDCLLVKQQAQQEKQRRKQQRAAACEAPQGACSGDTRLCNGHCQSSIAVAAGAKHGAAAHTPAGTDAVTGQDMKPGSHQLPPAYSNGRCASSGFGCGCQWGASSYMMLAHAYQAGGESDDEEEYDNYEQYALMHGDQPHADLEVSDHASSSMSTDTTATQHQLGGCESVDQPAVVLDQGPAVQQAQPQPTGAGTQGQQQGMERQPSQHPPQQQQQQQPTPVMPARSASGSLRRSKCVPSQLGTPPGSVRKSAGGMDHGSSHAPLSARGSGRSAGGGGAASAAVSEGGAGLGAGGSAGSTAATSEAPAAVATVLSVLPPPDAALHGRAQSAGLQSVASHSSLLSLLGALESSASLRGSYCGNEGDGQSAFNLLLNGPPGAGIIAAAAHGPGAPNGVASAHTNTHTSTAAGNTPQPVGHGSTPDSAALPATTGTPTAVPAAMAALAAHPLASTRLPTRGSHGSLLNLRGLMRTGSSMLLALPSSNGGLLAPAGATAGGASGSHSLDGRGTAGGAGADSSGSMAGRMPPGGLLQASVISSGGAGGLPPSEQVPPSPRSPLHSMTSGLTGVELVEVVRGTNSWVAVGAANEEQARVAEAAAEGFERATLEDSALDREPSAEIFLFARHDLDEGFLEPAGALSHDSLAAGGHSSRLAAGKQAHHPQVPVPVPSLRSATNSSGAAMRGTSAGGTGAIHVPATPALSTAFSPASQALLVPGRSRGPTLIASRSHSKLSLLHQASQGSCRHGGLSQPSTAGSSPTAAAAGPGAEAGGLGLFRMTGPQDPAAALPAHLIEKLQALATGSPRAAAASSQEQGGINTAAHTCNHPPSSQEQLAAAHARNQQGNPSGSAPAQDANITQGRSGSGGPQHTSPSGLHVFTQSMNGSCEAANAAAAPLPPPPPAQPQPQPRPASGRSSSSDDGDTTVRAGRVRSAMLPP